MAKEIPAEPAETEAPAAAAAPHPARRRRIVIAAAAVGLAAAAAGGAAWFFMLRDKAPATPPAEGDATEAAAEAPAPPSSSAPPQYLALSPAFVVNLSDTETMRYLQVDIEVMARDAAVLDAVKAHLPIIRNDLLLLMGQQKSADLETREGKEKLQAAALAEVQRILTEQTGKAGVEALYFTSLVMQ